MTVLFFFLRKARYGTSEKRIQKWAFFFGGAVGFTSFLKGWNGAGWVCKRAKRRMVQ